MAYNKAWAEKKWRLWKEAEEKQLRNLGVGEDMIQRLRKADWEDFNTERRYLQHYADTDTYLDWLAAAEVLPDIRTADDLLNDIDSEELHRLLSKVDKLTLQIAVWKMDGYSNAEISDKLGLSLSMVKYHIWHLKRKLLNFCES